MNSSELPLIKRGERKRKTVMAYGRDEFISCCSRGRVRKQHHDCDQRPSDSLPHERLNYFVLFVRAIKGTVLFLFVADDGDDYVKAALWRAVVGDVGRNAREVRPH